MGASRATFPISSDLAIVGLYLDDVSWMFSSAGYSLSQLLIFEVVRIFDG
jgi:hypothetical protein